MEKQWRGSGYKHNTKHLLVKTLKLEYRKLNTKIASLKCSSFRLIVERNNWFASVWRVSTNQRKRIVSSTNQRQNSNQVRAFSRGLESRYLFLFCPLICLLRHSRLLRMAEYFRVGDNTVNRNPANNYVFRTCRATKIN